MYIRNVYPNGALLGPLLVQSSRAARDDGGPGHGRHADPLRNDPAHLRTKDVNQPAMQTGIRRAHWVSGG
jgi:hypothetical protein